MAAKPSVITPRFRVAFPSVFRPGKPNDSGKAYYELDAIFPPGTDFTELKKLAKDAALAKWGSPDKFPANLRSPFRECPKKRQDGSVVEGFEEGSFIKLKSTVRPGLIGNGPKRKDPITNEEDFYGGCYARAEVTAFAYTEKGNSGVSFWFSNVQKMDEGSPFTSRRKADEVFDEVENSGPAAGSGPAAPPAGQKDSLFD